MLKLVRRIVIVEAGGSLPTGRATKFSSASHPVEGGLTWRIWHNQRKPRTPPEDLADRIRPRAARRTPHSWDILGFVAIFLIWAAFTELDRTVRRSRAGSSPARSCRSYPISKAASSTRSYVRTGQQVARRPRADPGSIARCRAPNSAAGRRRSARCVPKIAHLEAEVTRGRWPGLSGRHRRGHGDADRDRALAGPPTRMAESQRSTRRRRAASSRPSARRPKLQRCTRRARLRARCREHQACGDPSAGRARHRAAAHRSPRLPQRAAAVASRRRLGRLGGRGAHAQAGIAEARLACHPAAAGLALVSGPSELAAARAELAARQRALPALARQGRADRGARATARVGSIAYW